VRKVDAKSRLKRWVPQIQLQGSAGRGIRLLPVAVASCARNTLLVILQLLRYEQYAWPSVLFQLQCAVSFLLSTSAGQAWKDQGQEHGSTHPPCPSLACRGGSFFVSCSQGSCKAPGHCPAQSHLQNDENHSELASYSWACRSQWARLN
jgi:hypothetical protein